MEWISVKDELPPVAWSDPDENGKRYFYCPPVLILRETICLNGEKVISLAVGEHDTECIPDRWVICYYEIDDEYGLQHHDIEIHDVTHWMPLPMLPSFEVEKSVP